MICHSQYISSLMALHEKRKNAYVTAFISNDLSDKHILFTS